MSSDSTYTPADVREGDRVAYKIRGEETSGVVSASMWTATGARWRVTDSRPGAPWVWAEDGSVGWYLVSDDDEWAGNISNVRLIERASEAGTPPPVEWVRAVTSDASAHESDIALISAALHEEVRRRDWCTEFEDFLDRLNPRLSIPLTKPGPRVVRVTHEVTIEGATSDEDAIARALTQSTRSGIAVSEVVVSAEVVQP